RVTGRSAKYKTVAATAATKTTLKRTNSGNSHFDRRRVRGRATFGEIAFDVISGAPAMKLYSNSLAISYEINEPLAPSEGAVTLWLPGIDNGRSRQPLWRASQNNASVPGLGAVVNADPRRADHAVWSIALVVHGRAAGADRIYRIAAGRLGLRNPDPVYPRQD